MRLVIVSNRLPFTIAQRQGKIVFRESPGGLASGLRAYLDWLNKSSEGMEYLWIG
jgi:trehalose 6-phosphate synthase/phosphatase